MKFSNIKLSFIGLALAGAASLAFYNPSLASEKFLENMGGKWDGSGRAYLRGLGNIPASCDMTAKDGSGSTSLAGRCGILIYKIPLSINLKHEGGNRFSGVYTGSRTGPAALNGTLSGDVLTMQITWGGEVNGDRKATMILKRTSANSFSQTVTDLVKGSKRTTSTFSFKRQ